MASTHREVNDMLMKDAHHRRLAATTTEVSLEYGTQSQAETAAATAALASSFEPTVLQQEAELDGNDMVVTAEAVNVEPEEKKSRLGSDFDWMVSGYLYTILFVR